MNILVCFCVTPQWESVPDSEWTHFSVASDLSYVRSELNCFDESALEIALRLKDACEATEAKTECRLTAVTIEKPFTPAISRQLLAAGYGQVVRIDESTEFAPERTAELLADFIGEDIYDLILTGKEGGMAETGQVPVRLAARLHLPFLTEAEEVDLVPGDSYTLRITHRTDEGKTSTTTSAPLLVAIGNSPISALRAIPLKKLLATAKQGDDSRVLPTRHENRPPALPPITLICPKRENTCVFLDATDPDDLAGILLSEHLGGAQ